MSIDHVYFIQKKSVILSYFYFIGAWDDARNALTRILCCAQTKQKKKWFSCKMMFSHAKSDSEMLSERCGNKTVLFSIFDYKCRDAQQSLITKAWFACSDNRRTSISLYRSQAAFSMASIFTAIYFCLLIILLNNKMQVEQWIGVTYRARDSYCWTQERRVQ